jgi:hypothetical protein
MSKSVFADEMNTSFGPRINYSKWDFHDGMDLPASVGTPVYAVRDGVVYRAGDGGTDGYRSRHVVLEVSDPVDGTLYVPYIHLNSIDLLITPGAFVFQGQIIGTVGDDGASYSHLHIEFRKGKPNQEYSVHPLRYLPYVPTANFTAPVIDLFNRVNGQRMARLLFGAPSKLEGDLLRVEVDFLSGSTVLSTRVVDFNNKTTIFEGSGDDHLFTNDIGVEGYQKSNMVADERYDLKYGILVRNIPDGAGHLIARVMDLSGNIATSSSIVIPVMESD